MRERITFVEGPDFLYYSNGGSFIPGSIENALEHIGPQRHYRNECLCKGMVHFNMIDTVGRGIRRIYTEQKKRFFPMPDYEIDNDNRSVSVKIYGRMIDEKYTALLKRSNSLSLKECIWLDSIQKGRPVTKDAINVLKQRKLIEGSRGHYYISLDVARITDQIGKYTKNKGLAYNALKNLILQYADNSGVLGFKKNQVFNDLENSLPANKDYNAKLTYLGHLLSKMSGEGLIYAEGRTWFITDKGKNELRK